jgi:3-deoxy-manno-octulosonate cytidylyltransferase (CMP-KDO synthetase)
MKTLAVIPARWRSSRFPGKPLAEINGRAMIGYVWDQVARAKKIDDVVIATDDDRIANYCYANNMDVEMTSMDHETGTDRLAEVAIRRNADIYVNVQGDEPLIDPGIVDACTECLMEAMPRGIGVATGYVENATEDQKKSTSSVHVVPTMDGCVLTFSRFPIPLEFRESFQKTVHIGLYAFTRAALKQFSEWDRGPVERAESIELMRFLEHGERIACVAVQSNSIGVDQPEDIRIVEAVLMNNI